MSNRGRVYYGNQLAGHIWESEGGYLFAYHKDYLAGPSPKPVSLTLPLKESPYHSMTLFAFFDGLIPEGWLLDIATDHWKLNPNDRFELLLAACRDTIGAVTVVPEEETH